MKTNNVPQGRNEFYIDDITWNDLSMDAVYEKVNHASSSVGEEYLKRILRNCLMEEQPLRERSARASFFAQTPSVRAAAIKIFKNLGKTKKISLYEYIFRFHEIKPSGNAVHYLMILLLLASIALIFLNPVIGIIALVVMFIVNISTYFKYKSRVEGYFMCFKYIVRMLSAASTLQRVLKGKDPSVDLVVDQLAANCNSLGALKRGSWLLTNSVSGSLVDVVMDYIRMLFHVDIIKFNHMRKLAADKSEEIDALFCALGELESDICIALYRESLNEWCTPEFQTGHPMVIVKMYHPLTAESVTNDLEVSRSILLTGSNASGKSTFLKQFAINQIFAQTLYTCLAQQYRTAFFKVLSSMALSDNILGKESYFIVEIKSLKRIFDQVEESRNPDGDGIGVMCFIDEVLRGTNTRERVAASSQILKYLSAKGALCFAATHDIELTQLLADDMDNYHFREYVEGNDIRFDYKIHPGSASSRNAIRLMQAYGFDQSIVDAANAIAGNS